MKPMEMSSMADAFPAVLREKIKAGEFVFPSDTQFDYNDRLAYRCYFRIENDKSSICREDFRSYAEQGKRLRGNGQKKPEYYGTSLFTSLDDLHNVQGMNNLEKHIAIGTVYSDGGPIRENNRNSHICWWMFEKADISSFEEVGF